MANFLKSARSYYEKTKSWLLKRPALARHPYHPLGNTLQRYTLEDLPPFSLLQADVMLRDPHLVFGLMIRNGAVTQAEVEWTGNEAMVQFVSEQWARIWHDYGGALLRAKRYGWMPFEVIYEEIQEGPFRGMLGVKELRDYHPRDARLMVRDNEKAGVKFQRQLKRHAATIPFPASLWVTYDGQFGNRYGRSILNNAYVPFEEKWRDHGAKDVLRVRMMRDGYSGEIIWAPDQIMTVPNPVTGEKQDFHVMDIFRRALETKLAGGTAVFPFLKDGNGVEMVKYEPPHDNGRPDGILEWNERLDGEIWEGLGVIKEVAEASETGSGYSGRSIAMTTFLGLVTDEFKWILNDVLHDVLIPLAHINFGRDPNIDGRVRSLVETYAEDVSGTQMGGGALGGPASGGRRAAGVPRRTMPPQRPGPQQFSDWGGEAFEYDEETEPQFEFVSHPPFDAPLGFNRGIAGVQFGEFREEDHPRNKLGRFVRKGNQSKSNDEDREFLPPSERSIRLIKKSLEKKLSKDIHPKIRSLTLFAINDMAPKITPEAFDQGERNIRVIDSIPLQEAAAWEAIFGIQVVGYYDPETQTLKMNEFLIDFEEEFKSSFLHEYAHAIDQNEQFSGNPAWRSAWEEEMASGQLNEYSALSADEGFVELITAFCYPEERSVDTDILNHHFPKCIYFLRQYKVIP